MTTLTLQPTLEAKVRDFLAQKRIAVAGVSRNNNHHPAGNLIYRRLKNSGHEVFAVNPLMQTFECDPCNCRQRDIGVIAGACPMMFGDGVDLGHTCMRWFLKLTGGLRA